MTDFGRRTGIGDMLRTIYDPDHDGVVDAIPSHKTSHQDAGSDEIDCAGLAGRINFVDRGDPDGYDFAVAYFTTDGFFHDIDFTGIVPAGATAVYIGFQIRDGTVPASIYFRKKGQVNYHNRLMLRNQVAGKFIEASGFVSLDENLKAEYMTTPHSFTQIAVVVRGWSI